ncbi:MAG: class I SAM-dependent rRNA methyltransferase [Gammaproteobacteria bacterium]|nr:class I SAM-dependent rRNA methyltransferase [Gammaproteobacteria bacterium]
MHNAIIRLKPREDRRLRAGHLWIFSNEIDTDATPLKAFEPGDPVIVESASGRPLGVGYVNPRSLISVRLLSADPRQHIDRAFLATRVRAALAWREGLGIGPYYRLIFGEADGLPGLVVDRYGDALVAQITTAGMDRLLPDILASLEDVVQPASILLRNDTSSRALEGLPRTVEAALGEPPAEAEVSENGGRFRVSLQEGQKTGWFYDQRANRARLASYVKGKRVLDLFSYAGGFGIQAALAGAREVLLVDASQQALAYARSNAATNGVGERVATAQSDVSTFLKGLREEGRRFDVVICDPPALIKRRKDQDEGVGAYQRLNQAALAVVEDGGLLVSASCSHHLARDQLARVVGQAAVRSGRRVQFVEEGGQGPDHPVHPAIVETAYLKVLWTRCIGA